MFINKAVYATPKFQCKKTIAQAQQKMKWKKSAFVCWVEHISDQNKTENE